MILWWMTTEGGIVAATQATRVEAIASLPPMKENTKIAIKWSIHQLQGWLHTRATNSFRLINYSPGFHNWAKVRKTTIYVGEQLSRERVKKRRRSEEGRRNKGILNSQIVYFLAVVLPLISKKTLQKTKKRDTRRQKSMLKAARLLMKFNLSWSNCQRLALLWKRNKRNHLLSRKAPKNKTQAKFQWEDMEIICLSCRRIILNISYRTRRTLNS